MNKSLGILCFFLLLIGCTAQPKLDVLNTPIDSYPPPKINQASQGYPFLGPTPQATSEGGAILIPEDASTPAPGFGVVTGIILNNGKPVVRANLFLAGFIKDSSGKDSVAFVSPGKSPEVVTDDQGKFRFEGVPIGNYGMVIENMTDSFILMEPKSGEGLIVVVLDQQIIDVGTLEYIDLPIN